MQSVQRHDHQISCAWFWEQHGPQSTGDKLWTGLKTLITFFQVFNEYM